MANTYDSNLVQEIMSDVAITTLGPVLARMNAFTMDVSVDPMSPRSATRVPLVTDGSNVLTNPNDFEIGDGVVSSVLVEVDQKSVPFHASNTDLQKGFRVRMLLEKNMQVLANELTDIIFAPLLVGNYGAAALDLAGGTFSRDDLKALWVAASNFNNKNLIIDGPLFSELIPSNNDQFDITTSGAYGFDSIMHHGRWSGAGPNVVGFVADSDAIAIATGVPYTPEELERELTGLEQVVLPNGLTVQLYSWVSTKTRAVWRSLDVMIGAAVGDPAKVKLIRDTGTP